MQPETLLALLHEIEQEDPIDFTGLPFKPDDLRRLACLNVSDMMQSIQATQPEQREMILAATVVRLVLENMLLHARVTLLGQKEGGNG